MTSTQRAWSSFIGFARYAVLIILCVIVMSPVVTAVLGSIRTNGEFLSTPFGLPQSGIQWVNYTDILLDSGFWNLMRNS
nr:hypothetical protein [Anaerolineae bacterium]